MGSKKLHANATLAAAVAKVEDAASEAPDLKEILAASVAEARAALKGDVENFAEAVKADAYVAEAILNDIVLATVKGDTALNSELQAQLRSLVAKEKKKAAQVALDSLQSSATVALKIISKLAGLL